MIFAKLRNRLLGFGISACLAPLALSQPATSTALTSIAMDPAQPRAQRIEAIRELYPQLLLGDELPQRTICVWDVMGRNGPVYAAAQDQQSQLLALGVQIELQAYTNEGVLTDDLKAGQCDAALFTGIRAREFNRFAGTIDAVGAIPAQQHMQMLLQVLANPKMAARMEQGPYVVMGVAPMGAAYVFVNDRKISTLAKASGKRIAVMDYDPIQAEMILGLGGNPVPTSIVSAGSKFNNGFVDVLPAPLVAYHVMELYHGIGEQGGIVDYPFSQLTLQLVGRKDAFPTEVAQLVREDFAKRLAEIEQRVAQQTGDIPDDVWIDISDEDKREYQTLMQQARIELRDRGYYDADMLRLQRRIRCKFEPAHPECSAQLE
ncbi:hypothetical protein CHH28_10680 [Bacterioplanes sanyensis]|uniref:C4-dicarboxylate ABC transporter substrate-binding protein n=1 Tax=Bacterioplanes sanyensis TaxID=1249553 RepID=A0A222FJ93_9GAMM|nr:putative solute-binding protein [Bacterioplanes sanyensis]ASP39115.1 hypothetical protein CHH28_10680 [Bacterioplanes sanyensis]